MSTEPRTNTEHLDRIADALRGFDGEYSLAARDALESLTALRASIEEMERQRKSWEAANQDVQCKLDCAWTTHNNYADKVERAIGKITEAEVDLPIPDIIAGRSAQIEALIVERQKAIEALHRACFPWYDGDPKCTLAVGIDATSGGWKLAEYREAELRKEVQHLIVERDQARAERDAVIIEMAELKDRRSE